MLDARAAVAAAIGVQARVSVTTAAPTAGEPVTIASTSVIGAGQSATYLWAIVATGTTGATITGANDADTVTVAPTTAGTFTISLTTTDNNGYVSTASTAVIVAAAPTPPPPSAERRRRWWRRRCPRRRLADAVAERGAGAGRGRARRAAARRPRGQRAGSERTQGLKPRPELSSRSPASLATVAGSALPTR